MSKPFRSYFPNQHEPTTLVQGQVPSQLHDEVRKFLDEEGATWSDCLKASLKWFADRAKRERRKKAQA